MLYVVTSGCLCVSTLTSSVGTQVVPIALAETRQTIVFEDGKAVESETDEAPERAKRFSTIPFLSFSGCFESLFLFRKR